MFGLDAVSVSTHERTGGGLWLGRGGRHPRPGPGDLRQPSAPAASRPSRYAVGGYITAAYWFTSSTSFANPAVTVARMFSDTFAGIAPASVPDVRPHAARRRRARRSSLVAPVTHPEPPGRRRRMTDRPTVLFVCVHNAGRSQMAAGYLQHLAGDRIEVLSAGSAAGRPDQPRRGRGDGRGGHRHRRRARPRCSPTEAVQESDVVVTMGCGDECPYFPGKRYEDWVLDDPAGQGIEAVRPIRDEIQARVEAARRGAARSRAD